MKGLRLSRSLGIEEHARRRFAYYVEFAIELGLEKPENAVKLALKKERNERKRIWETLRKLANKPKRKRTPKIKRKPSEIKALKKIVECTARINPLCLRRFVSLGEEVCVKCKNTHKE